MVSFENFKEKALATAGKVADRSVCLAKAAGDKAKLVGRITKLRTEIAMEKDTARKAYAEIGKLYYDKYRHSPDPDMAQTVTEVSMALEAIEAKKKEIAALKKQMADDFDETVEEVEDTVDDVVEDVKDAVEDVVDKVTGDE